MKNPDETRPQRVSGRIHISPGKKNFGDAVAHVYLEDISRADAAAAVIAETEIRSLRPQSEEKMTIPFELKISDSSTIDPKGRYRVRVWINVNGDGKQSGEDFYTDRIYPVLTGGHGNFVDITIDS
jgi:uncharacterized lipoprotein YbaY